MYNSNFEGKKNYFTGEPQNEISFLTKLSTPRLMI